MFVALCLQEVHCKPVLIYRHGLSVPKIITMKTIFILLVSICLCDNVYAQRMFNFKIDQQDYQIDEKSLNDLFGSSFNSLVQRGTTSEKHFDLWVRTYNEWKDQIIKGVFSWDTYGDHVSNSRFMGPDIPIEYLGWKAPGKEPTGNPNKESNTALRVQIINTWISRGLIYYFTKKVIVN